MTIPCFILAAGEGTRMRPLTANIPKPLLPVAGKPFILHTLEALRDAGIQEVALLIGWRGRRIKDILGTGQDFGLNISYVEQEERQGTAAAVGLARGVVRGDFLCLNGDILVGPRDIKAFVDFASSRGQAIALARVDHPEHLGVVATEGDRVVEIEEKPTRARGNLVNAGMYYFRKDVFRLIEATQKSKRGEFEVTDTLRLLMQEEGLHAYPLGGPWISVEYPWDLLAANSLLLGGLKGRIDGEVEPHATLRGPVVVAKGAVVRNGTYVVGPTIIAEDSEVGPNCYIRPSTYLGRGTRVGSACEVKNSIVMDHSHIPHNNYVGDSILGERCNLGAGTKVANLRLDEGNIKAVVRGRGIDTGLRKLGVIMGDDVKTGINASIDVGTVVGENSFIGPGAVVRGNLAAGSRIY